MKHFGLLKNVIFRFNNTHWHFYCPESYPKDERKNKFSKKSFKLTKFKNKKKIKGIGSNMRVKGQLDG